MTDISARIVTSHKEAAKRAADYLKKNLNFKVSSVESLEMVARTLGVANWPTLQSMAKQGRGPRIDSGKEVVPAPAAQPVVEKSVVEKLKDYYGIGNQWGECPEYSLNDWQSEVENDDTRLGYWEMVEHHFEEKFKMYPWERDADINVKLATEAGLEVQHASDYEHADDDEDNCWFVVDADGDALFDPVDSEAEAWEKAAKHATGRALKAAEAGHYAYTKVQGGSVSEAVAKMKDALKPEAFEEALQPGELIPKAPESSYQAELARFAGLYARYDANGVVYPGWGLFDGRGTVILAGFSSEEEALAYAERKVKDDVCTELSFSPEEWDCTHNINKFSLLFRSQNQARLRKEIAGRISVLNAALDGADGGTMSQEARESAAYFVATAAAAKTLVGRTGEGWVVYQSRSKKALDIAPQRTEEAAWLMAAYAVITEVVDIGDIGYNRLAEYIPAKEREALIQKAYKGRPVLEK